MRLNFLHKEEYNDFVDLSIGRVYLRVLTNKIITTVTIKSTIMGDILNNALYFSLIEKELTVLNQKQLDKLSIADANKLREAIKTILIRHGLITVEPVKEISDSEKNALNDQFEEVQKKWGSKDAKHG